MRSPELSRSTQSRLRKIWGDKVLIPTEFQTIPSAAQRLPSDMLIDIALCEDLFHTASGTAFADIIVGGHRETWPVRSKSFRAFLRRSYYRTTGEAASAAEIRSALDLLEARAQFDGPERVVHIRTAEHAGHIYLDLADEHWRAV